MGKPHSHRNRNRRARREQFMRPPRRRRGWIPVAAVGLLSLGLIGNYIASQARENGLSPAEPVVPVGDEIRIPLAGLAGGEAKFFRYSADGQDARFFVLRGSDGVSRAALDACEICYASKRGYSQRGDEMVCRKCEQSFPSALINEVTGGCHPIGLPRTMDGEHLVLQASQIQAIDRQYAAQAAGAVAAGS